MTTVTTAEFDAVRSWSVAVLKTCVLAQDISCTICAAYLRAAEEDVASQRNAQDLPVSARNWQQLHSLPWDILAHQIQRSNAAARHLNTLIGQLGSVCLQQYMAWTTVRQEHQRYVTAASTDAGGLADTARNYLGGFERFIRHIEESAAP